jgi:hypothetical protein
MHGENSRFIAFYCPSTQVVISEVLKTPHKPTIHTRYIRNTSVSRLRYPQFGDLGGVAGVAAAVDFLSQPPPSAL